MSPARKLVEADGEWGISEGAIYSEFIENEKDFYQVKFVPQHRTFIINGKSYRLAYLNIGGDWGGTTSGHAFCATGITENFEYVIALKSVWHDAHGTTPEQGYKALERFVNEVESLYGRIDDIYLDSAAQLMLNMCREKLSKRAGVRNSLKREIIDRIDFTNAVLEQRRIRIMPGQCVPLAEFLKNAVWDDKVLHKKRLDDGSYDVDSGDCYEYSLERYFGYIVAEVA